MDRLDYYFRQKVTEAELDQGFENCELADRAMMTDQGLVGRTTGLAPTQAAPTPGISIDVGSGVAYDQAGQRIFVPQTENVDVTVDNSAVSTDVATPGNSKIVSVFVEFERDLTDPRIDGNSNTVFFDRAESFTFFVKQGAESAGTPSPPALESGRILIADITRTYGQTQILNANIDTSRREDLIKVAAKTATPQISEGTIEEAIDAVVELIDSLATGGGSVTIPASSVNYSGSPAWNNGETIPATTVEIAIDTVVSDLAKANVPGDDGADKIGIYTRSSGSAFGWSVGSVRDALSDISDQAQALYDSLISTAGGNDGADFVGAEATGGFSGTTVRAQLDELDGSGGAGIVGALASGGLPAGSVASQLAVLDQADVTAKIFWVNAAASAGGTGRQHDPFDEINDALVAAANINGATIMVAPGAYAGFNNGPGHSNFDWRIVAYGPTRSTTVVGDSQVLYRGNANSRRFLFDGLTIIPATSGQSLVFTGTAGSTYAEFANCYMFDMAVTRGFTGTGDKLRIYAHGREAMDLLGVGPTKSDYLFGGTSGTPYEISVTLRNIAVQMAATMQVYQLFAENMVMFAGASQDINIWHDTGDVTGAFNVMRSRLGGGALARIGSTDLLQGYWDTVTNYWRYVDGLSVTNIQPNIMHNEAA